MRPKREINEGKMSKKQNKMEAAIRNDVGMKRATYLAVEEKETQKKGR